MSEIKYKLLKELPFCPIGTIGKIDNDEELLFNNDYCFPKHQIEDLIEQGWIEEYKPKSQEELVVRILNVYDNSGTLEKALQLILEKYEIKEKE